MLGFFLIPLFFTLIPVFAWGWRSLFAVVLIVGGLFGFLWMDHGIASAERGYDPGIGGAIAIGLLEISTIGFGLMAFARGLGLLLQAFGWSRFRVFWADALGLATAAAIVFGPGPFGLQRLSAPGPGAWLREEAGGRTPSRSSIDDSVRTHPPPPRSITEIYISLW